MHMSQLMPLPLTVSCFSKIQIGFTFLVPAYPGSLGKRAVKRVCVCVCFRGKEEVSSQKMPYFPTAAGQCFCTTPCETGNRKYRHFFTSPDLTQEGTLQGCRIAVVLQRPSRELETASRPADAFLTIHPSVYPELWWSVCAKGSALTTRPEPHEMTRP